MRWAGHAAGKGEKRNYSGFWWGNLKEVDNSLALCLHGRIILKRFLKK
jgi:hypothetical protein